MCLFLGSFHTLQSLPQRYFLFCALDLGYQNSRPWMSTKKSSITQNVHLGWTCGHSFGYVHLMVKLRAHVHVVWYRKPWQLTCRRDFSDRVRLARIHRKKIILNYRIKLAFERVLYLVCTSWLDDLCLWFKFRRHVNSLSRLTQLGRFLWRRCFRSMAKVVVRSSFF